MPITTLQVVDLSFDIATKPIIKKFSTSVFGGEKVALLGRNGSGKSTLLKIIAGKEKEFSGQIVKNSNTDMAYVAQEIQSNGKSGGEALIQKLQEAFHSSQGMILLDEPTNHLDSLNRNYLNRLIDDFTGTLIVATHDEDFIRRHFTTLWVIKNDEVKIFKGSYDDYQREMSIEHENILTELKDIKKSKTALHQDLMKEQERAKKSRSYGEKKYADVKIVTNAKKGLGEKTSNIKSRHLNVERTDLLKRFEQSKISKIVLPAFFLTPKTVSNDEVLSISDGAIQYKETDKIVRSEIYLSLQTGKRLQITGRNGSGKSTLLKAIMNDDTVERLGNWCVSKDCFYFDQNYSSLAPGQSVIDTIEDCCEWSSSEEKRKFLAEFLFMTNNEIENKVENLSGGEKARLCLAQIASKRPSLLLLDEVSNNLDIETKNHLVDVLKDYKGAMVIVSHDRLFVEKIGVDNIFKI